MGEDNKKSTVDDSVDEILEDEETKTDKIDSEPVTLVLADEKESQVSRRHPLRHKLAKFFKSGWGKTLVVFVVITGVIFAVPMTRYAVLGFFIKKQAIIIVVDDTTGKPVSDALVHFARADATTDKNGVVALKDMPVGDHPLSVEKKYYQTASTSYTVPVFSEAKITLKLKATGRMAAITVKNLISGKPLPGAAVKIGDTSAVTSDNGVANVALAIQAGDQPGAATLNGYAPASFTVNTKDMAPVSEVVLTPSGRLYFLSNRSGTIDVMSSQLDGTGQEVVLAGTGQELSYEMQLIANGDQSKLALSARREANKPSLYIIDTASKSLTKIDVGTGTLLIGWAGNTLYFTNYNNMQAGAVADGRFQLISYDAAANKRSVVDTSIVGNDTSGQVEQGLSSRFQLDAGKLYYAKCWSYVGYYGSELHQKVSLNMLSDGKVTTLKQLDQTKPSYCDTLVKKPGLVYFKVTNTNDYNDVQYYRYQAGKAIETVQLSEADFTGEQITYYASPNNEKTFWTETRDGKPMSFVGDISANNARQTGGGDNFRAAGWLGNDYIIYSKNSNELYVMSSDGQGDMHKVTDYFYLQHGAGY